MYKNKDFIKRIDENIASYKFDKNKESALNLLHLFGFRGYEEKPVYFIGKYYKLITYGKMNFKDEDLIKFVSLYVGDEIVNDLIKEKFHNEFLKKKMMHVLNELKYNIDVEDDELLTDIVLVFLEILNIFNYEESFYLFLKNNFNKALFEKIKTKDNNLNVSIEYHDNLHINKKEDKDIHIDNQWVINGGNNNSFKDLTPEERLIIKMIYHDNMNTSKISKILNMKKVEILKIKQNALRKIIENRSDNNE